MKVMLDTNICIAVIRGNPKAIARLSSLSPGDCSVSVITAYELFTGVAKCLSPAKEQAKVQLLLSSLGVLPFDEPAAKHAGQVRASLEQIGNTCGPYDLLLAGHALSRGLKIATNNVREFSRVNGLVVEDWIA